MGGQPAGDVDESPGEQADVEHVGPVALLGRCEQVEQQGAQTRPVENAGDIPVAWTVPTTATAVREYHYPAGPFGNREVARHRHGPGLDPDLLVAQGRVAGACRCPGGGGDRTGAVEKRDHLVIGGLGEIPVCLTDGEDVLRRQ